MHITGLGSRVPLDNIPGRREEALLLRERRVICCHEGEVCSHVCRDRAMGGEDCVEASVIAEGEC